MLETPQILNESNATAALVRGDALQRLLRELLEIWNGLHLRLVVLQFLVRCLPLAPGGVRSRLYRWAGFRGIESGCFFLGPLDLRGKGDLYSRLHIGQFSGINPPCSIELNADVHIGAHVFIGHDTMIITTTHA